MSWYRTVQDEYLLYRNRLQMLAVLTEVKVCLLDYIKIYILMF